MTIALASTWPVAVAVTVTLAVCPLVSPRNVTSVVIVAVAGGVAAPPPGWQPAGWPGEPGHGQAVSAERLGNQPGKVAVVIGTAVTGRM